MDGNKEWYLNGNVIVLTDRLLNLRMEMERKVVVPEWKLHRTDGPAIECANGSKSWYLNGKRHRTDGPAIEWANGDTTERSWYLNGKLHRTDGPAKDWPSKEKRSGILKERRLNRCFTNVK
jgi:hypothetical protein